MKPLWVVSGLGLALVLGCARPGRPPDLEGGMRPPEADSATKALWRMDERDGTAVHDAGPFRLDGTAGRDVRHVFGRFGGALSFERSKDSFAFVPYNPTLESPRSLTVEAWVYLERPGDYEDTPLVARWTDEANQQSWILSVAGRRLPQGLVTPGPGLHLTLFPDAAAGRVLFAYQPDQAGPPRAYVSAGTLEIGRWTHVAVTYDGEVVRLFLDGVLDAQFASTGRIRTSQAPLLIANAFDVRLLTRFGGDLRLAVPDDTPIPYAFVGRLDEIRISGTARSDFPTLTSR